MSETWASLAEQFFGKPLSDCSVDELQTVADQYPFVGPLQLMLLSKLEPDTPEYSAQYSRSILYFPTPAHLHFALSQQHDSEVEKQTAPQPKEEVATSSFTLAPETAAQIENLELSTPEPDLLPAAISVDEVPPASEVLNAPSTIETTTAPDAQQQQPNLATPPVVEPTKPEPAEELSFEPYHTVDYFASQGIKLSKEEVGTDKFGKQLKSFTEWLKTMKRLPAQQANAAESSGEKGLNSLAEKSVADAQVLTESMAEVWEKQGAMDKATEVYHKLSLLHPSKRAYFAAKIEALKDKK